MNPVPPPQLTRDLLCSARVFTTAVHDVFEADLLREVAGERLSFSQFKLLYLVAQTDPVTIGDAAEFLRVSRPAASKAVDKLVRRRLLRRADIQGDRRSSHLTLTEASRRLVDTYEAARNQKAAEIFAQFSEEELRHTSVLLDRLAAGIVGEQPGRETVCMGCEVYFRRPCRFGDLAARDCFYRRQQGEARDNRGGNGHAANAPA